MDNTSLVSLRSGSVDSGTAGSRNGEWNRGVPVDDPETSATAAVDRPEAIGGK